MHISGRLWRHIEKRLLHLSLFCCGVFQYRGEVLRCNRCAICWFCAVFAALFCATKYFWECIKTERWRQGKQLSTLKYNAYRIHTQLQFVHFSVTYTDVKYSHSMRTILKFCINFAKNPTAFALFCCCCCRKEFKTDNGSAPIFHPSLFCGAWSAFSEGEMTQWALRTSKCQVGFVYPIPAAGMVVLWSWTEETGDCQTVFSSILYR